MTAMHPHPARPFPASPITSSTSMEPGCTTFRRRAGSPILLVHGFPETWWAFRKVIPLLAERHRVFAVDLRGFGDSEQADGDYSSAAVGAKICTS